jgi:hypothetical protein
MKSFCHKTKTGPFVIALFVLLIFSDCKKNAGRHCPVYAVTSYNTAHLTDISPVGSVKQIMDTLSAHPEFQAYRVRYNAVPSDPSNYSAIVSCNVFHKGLLVFETIYSMAIYSQSENHIDPIPVINVNTEPQISAEKADEIARKATSYETCAKASLGIKKYEGEYKLIWRTTTVEQVYPIVDLDAHTGEIYYVVNGPNY